MVGVGGQWERSHAARPQLPLPFDDLGELLLELGRRPQVDLVIAPDRGHHRHVGKGVDQAPPDPDGLIASGSVGTN
jgi:hypothetical protein